MPAEAKAVLVSKCADSYSSETRWRVYARIAPGSCLVESDIVEARRRMDLSRWEQMPVNQQEVLMLILTCACGWRAIRRPLNWCWGGFPAHKDNRVPRKRCRSVCFLGLRLRRIRVGVGVSRWSHASLRIVGHIQGSRADRFD